MKINGVSASAYNCYGKCEFQYFLTYIVGLTSESGPAAWLGTVSHKVLECLSKASIIRHRKDSKIWNPEYLWECAYNYYAKLEPYAAAEVKTDKLKTVCKGLYDLIHNSEHTPIRDNTIDVEVGFNIPIEEKRFWLDDQKYFVLRGRIDRVDKINDDTIEIIDYKSGSRSDFESPDRHKKQPSDLFKDIQPRMYHVAAKHLYPWAKNIIVNFIYFTDGGSIQVGFSDEDLKVTQDIVYKRFKAIEANQDPQRNKGWHCNKLCSYGPSGQCDAYWSELKELGFEFTNNKYTVLKTQKQIRK